MTAEERTFILELANRAISPEVAEDIGAAITAEAKRLRLTAEAELRQVEQKQNQPAKTHPIAQVV